MNKLPDNEKQLCLLMNRPSKPKTGAFSPNRRGRVRDVCGTVPQWQRFVRTECLRANAPLNMQLICSSAIVALQKVEQTAREAWTAYDRALAARRELGDQ